MRLARLAASTPDQGQRDKLFEVRALAGCPAGAARPTPGQLRFGPSGHGLHKAAHMYLRHLAFSASELVVTPSQRIDGDGVSVQNNGRPVRTHALTATPMPRERGRRYKQPYILLKRRSCVYTAPAL
jgi:hypothetical protein